MWWPIISGRFAKGFMTIGATAGAAHSAGLRILLTNTKIADYSGSELYIRDVALALLRRGHTPVVYSPRLGALAQELQDANIPVVNDLHALRMTPDLIHGQHHLECMTALAYWPGVPVVYFCHGTLPWEEVPPHHPRILHYVTVSEYVQRWLRDEHGIPEARLSLVRNFVDLQRFGQRAPLPPRPKRALIFSNQATQENYASTVRQAWTQQGTALDIVGLANGNPTSQPETLLRNYDLVFARGRAALESLAVGAAVVCCDVEGLGEMVTTSNMERLLSRNLGHSILDRQITVDLVREQIRRYDPVDAHQVTELVRASAGMEAAVDRIEVIYAAVRRAWSVLNAADLADENEAMARYLQWLSRSVPNLVAAGRRDAQETLGARLREARRAQQGPKQKLNASAAEAWRAKDQLQQNHDSKLWRPGMPVMGGALHGRAGAQTHHASHTAEQKQGLNMDTQLPGERSRLSEQKKWDSYYAELPLGEEDELTHKFNAQLVSAVSTFLKPGSQILEAGCGGGWQSLALARTNHYTVSLMDFSENALGYAKRVFEREQMPAAFLAGDVLAPGEPAFDLVFNAGVLEHYTLEEQVTFLRGMASRSRQYVLVLVPNSQCYWYWLWRISSVAAGQWPFGKEVPTDDLSAAFAAAGLSVVGRAFLGQDWTESFIRQVSEAAPELRDQILAIHSSSLIPASQKSYLVAWLGVVPGIAPVSLPQWALPGAPPESLLPEALSALADALALRIGAESRLTDLQAQISVLERSTTELHSQLAVSQAQVNVLEQSTTELNSQLAVSQAQVSVLEQSTTELHSQLAGSQAQVSVLEQSTTELHSQLAVSEQAVAKLDVKLSDKSRLLMAREAEWVDKDKVTADLQGRLQAQAQALSARENDTAKLRAELAVIHGLKSWRLMTVYWRLVTALRWSLANAYQEFRAFLRHILPYDIRHAVVLRMRNVQRPLIQPSAINEQTADDVAGSLEIGDFYSALTLRPTLSSAQAAEIVAGRTLPRPRRLDVISFSIIDWSWRYQRPQQLMSQFAAHGHRVFYINLTQPLPANAKTKFAVRPIKENVYELFLPAPHPLDLYGNTIEGEYLASLLAALDDLRKAYNITDAVSYLMIASWGSLALEARRRWGWRIIYDCMDEWENFPGIGRSVLEMEPRVVAAADLVVVTAQRLYEKWQSFGRPMVLARNAVDMEFYEKRLQPNTLLAEAKHPIVGYYGAIADWFDLDLMQYLAKRRPKYTFVLIGGIFDVNTSALERLPNVKLLGQQPYERMPAYLYHFDACLIPFKINSITQATDPVKLYEYLSAGKPVVATALAELELYRDHIYLSANREEFLANLDRAVIENDPERVERRKGLAQANTWERRYQAIADGVSAQVARASIVVVTYNNLMLSRLCLESVVRNTAYPNYELVVIDNHSSDGTQDYLRMLTTQYANVHIKLNDDNLGFARANNQGLEQTTGEFLILLNNDTIVPPGWLSRLLRHLQDETIGLIGPVTNFVGNEAKVDVDYVNWQEMEGFARTLNWRYDDELADIPMLAMYCVGMRRSVFEAIGPLDEQFGVGMFEDDDYTQRARLKGFRVVCAPDVFVHHFGQAAFGQLIRDGRYNQLFENNRQLYEAKWQTKWVPHQHRRLAPYPHNPRALISSGPIEPTQAIQPQPEPLVEAIPVASEYDRQVLREKKKWGDHLQVEASGAWNAWLDHPLISSHYNERSLLDGVHWEQWVINNLGGPAEKSLDLGCGAGDRSMAVYKAGASLNLEGIDISDDRVAEGERRRQAMGVPGHLWVGDVNALVLPENTYDLIFSCHSFHHFLKLERVMEQVLRALTPRGLFILEEFVGPTQFQWTDLQIRLTRELLGQLPQNLRRFRDGCVKDMEGRPTPAEVVAVSPFESIRSDEIWPLFQKHFNVITVRNLGGTIQHLLYNGIIHNFDPSDQAAAGHMRNIYQAEDNLVDSGQIPSDFKLLVGCKPDIK
jgi:GT2 family glycosyltransferase/ubiquinone/menaquinone biosynthesis C-methylase UbiE/glycosyltransferase involved in cell wall biosynthesis